jgi:predicted extracellular nuclease
MAKFSFGIAALAIAAAATAASAQIRITEWMYTPVSGQGEFIELTNIGASPIDMNGWSFDDDSRLPGVLNLSAFGVVAPGESVIITDATASAFRTTWSLPASVKVIGGNTANIGRNDEINIFNGVTLVDRLTYGDESFVGTIRTSGRSGNTLPANLGLNTVSAWTISSVGDI